VFDKTGTLTTGTPTVESIEVFGRYDGKELLHLAASLDQVSPHVFAEGIVAAATQRHIDLDFPESVREFPGTGIEGPVCGHRVALGQAKWVAAGKPMPPEAGVMRLRVSAKGASAVYVAVDGEIEGALVMADPVRPESAGALRALRHAGIRRIVLLSGDRRDVAGVVGAALGVDAVLSEHTPAQKVQAVRDERAKGVTVMVGDGVNDAPALAAADVGIAMGARGATASSEAADAVIVVDSIDRVGEAILISRRARAIAVQSVVAGMALSVAGMVFAASGWLPPVAGAVFQEVIDVAVILNALRALRPGPDA